MTYEVPELLRHLSALDVEVGGRDLDPRTHKGLEGGPHGPVRAPIALTRVNVAPKNTKTYKIVLVDEKQQIGVGMVKKYKQELT